VYSNDYIGSIKVLVVKPVITFISIRLIFLGTILIQVK